MPSTATSLMLTTDERQTLETYARSRKGRADLAHRARAILLLADGVWYTEVTMTLGWSSATIAKWKARFEAQRLAGLWGLPSRASARRRWKPAFSAGPESHRRTGPRIGPRGRSASIWACPTPWLRGCGNEPACNRIAWSDMSDRRMRRSRRKPRTSSGCI